MEIRFMVPDSLKSVMAATGLPVPQDATVCPFVVGDVIAWGAPHPLAVRVVRRWLSPASERHPTCWVVEIEQTGHPLDAPPSLPTRAPQPM